MMSVKKAPNFPQINSVITMGPNIAMWSTQYLIVYLNVSSKRVTVNYTLTLASAIANLLSAVGGIIALVYFTIGAVLDPL